DGPAAGPGIDPGPGPGAPGQPSAAPQPGPAGPGNAAPRTDGALLPPGERDELMARLQKSMNGFVDGPRGSVEEADIVFETLSARLGDLLGERRRALRTAWYEDAAGPGTGGGAETEDLRRTLLGYRDLVERLLRL
ncbi:hypothetical protein, partial [Streptomyces stramineus]|uniref:hypothetical protein n=1 Tax=Streptomyces stramineus TaxID=173861 RepID=UPI0031D79123